MLASRNKSKSKFSAFNSLQLVMKASRRPKNPSKGFTLIEIVAVTVIIGILSAIATPNLIGLWGKAQVKFALAEITGAIKESQREAIRRARLCRININPNDNLLTGNPSNCLLGIRQVSPLVTIRTNLSGTPPNISFSHKGSTTKSGTIVVSSPLTNFQKCFVISLGVGIVRTGDYIGSDSGSVSATSCQPEN